jgi:hypothetical protein
VHFLKKAVAQNHLSSASQFPHIISPKNPKKSRHYYGFRSQVSGLRRAETAAAAQAGVRKTAGRRKGRMLEGSEASLPPAF